MTHNLPTALIAAATYPITDPNDQDAANIRALAETALVEYRKFVPEMIQALRDVLSMMVVDAVRKRPRTRGDYGAVADRIAAILALIDGGEV